MIGGFHSISIRAFCESRTLLLCFDLLVTVCLSM
nr:MAG TPA: hypothetical protein [Caudoviricetes sp.]DAQ89451.1 MAG TPA: hypothetical protein [Caudoviricetes sp.]DAU89170.1 MAG TPA: hypothetical protein [Caudoviricetes sp.]